MVQVTKTHLPDKEKFQHYVDQIYASGWLTNNGQMVQQLEGALRDFMRTEYLILTVNGTCALQLAYKLLGLSGEVITTPFTFVATVSSLCWEGLTPVFADIDGETLNMDPARIEEKIGPATSAILPVHVFGNVCDVEKIDSIAKKYRLPVIYDAAHAFDVTLSGQNVSEFGDVVAYSFHSTKVYHTIEGGAVIVRTKELYEKALLMRNFGIPGYDIISELGVNYKMNEFQAAMGLCMLDEYRHVSVSRAKVFQRYTDAFIGNRRVSLQRIANGVKLNYAYFPVLFGNEERLLAVKAELLKCGIQARRYFYPSLNTLPFVKRQDAPISESVASRILCLPLYQDLDPIIQEQIIAIVLKGA